MSQKPLPQRKSPRLQDYDYSQSGAYFLSFCTYDRIHHFGIIQSGILSLTPVGELAYAELSKLEQYWKMIDLDLFIIMPNHVHAIIVLHEKIEGEKQFPTVGEIIRNYKAGVTRKARQIGLIDKTLYLWQGRYHDRIIRNQRELDYVRNYIATNPERCDADYYNQ